MIKNILLFKKLIRYYKGLEFMEIIRIIQMIRRIMLLMVIIDNVNAKLIRMDVKIYSRNLIRLNILLHFKIYL
jgi:hypothetical protein